MLKGMTRGQRLLMIAPMAILGMALFVTLGTLLVRALWNWLVPSLFGGPALGFWQALGILALCRILVGGFGFRGNTSPWTRRRIFERYQAMNPEEQERFRRGLGGMWGFPPPGSGEPGKGETL